MPALVEGPALRVYAHIGAVGMKELGVSQKRVLPEPDEPITQAFKFRALAGIFGRVFMVRNSVPVKMTLFWNFGSTNGLMSSGVPHRAVPYSASRRNFFAFCSAIRVLASCLLACWGLVDWLWESREAWRCSKFLMPLKL